MINNFWQRHAAARRALSLAAAGCLCLTTPLVPSPSALAQTSDSSTSNSSGGNAGSRPGRVLSTNSGMDPSITNAAMDSPLDAEWGSNMNRVGQNSPVSASLQSVTPQTVQTTGTVTVKLSVRNNSKAAVSNIVLRLQRGEALNSADSARTVLADAESTYAVASKFSDALSLAPGESRDVTMTVPVSAAAPDGLGIDATGVYPILANVNGRPEGDIDRLLTETRTLLPVSAPREAAPTSSNDQTTEAGEAAESGETNSSVASAGQSTVLPKNLPFSMVYPIAEYVPILTGETGEAPDAPELIMSDDSLADSLRPGGRLHSLLTALEAGFSTTNGNELKSSTCLAIDPETISAVSRMTQGYLVGSQRPSPVKSSQRLRDSWGGGDDIELTQGSGKEAATQWLDRLRTVTENACVVALPWASAGISDVADVANRDVTADALASGRDVLAKILGTAPATGVYLPPEGYLTERAIPLLSDAERSAKVNSDTDYENRHATTTPEAMAHQDTPPPPATALVAANSVTKSDGSILAAGESGSLSSTTRAFALPGALSAALAASGSQPTTSAFANPTGRYDFQLDSSQARMQTSIATLYQELYDAAVHHAGQSKSDQPAINQPGGGFPNTGQSDSEQVAPESPKPEHPATAAPLIAMPPAEWSPSEDEAKSWLLTISGLLGSKVLASSPLQNTLQSAATGHDTGTIKPVEFKQDPGGLPAATTDSIRGTAEAVNAATHVMANDPNVALTRYEFTRPLRLDLIRALGSFGRRNVEKHESAKQRSQALITGAAKMTQQLTDSVELVAPGGVYTRATGASPVIVLGRNGLPLPVPGFVRVESGGRVSPERFDATLPAKGSVTVQFNPQRTADNSANTMQMWLENPDGLHISKPVSVSLQSGASVGALVTVTLIVIAVGGYFAAKRSRRFRK